MKLLKRIAFCLLGILLFVLTIATILEKVNGTEFVNNHISVSYTHLLGSTPFMFPGIHQPVKLGLAGGPLIISILISRFGPQYKQGLSGEYIRN